VNNELNVDRSSPSVVAVLGLPCQATAHVLFYIYLYA